MQKGQISFDLILAITVALIFIGGIQTLNQQMGGMQRHSAVKNQEKLIALQVHNVISTAKTLSDADDLTVSFKTKKLLVPGGQFLEECLIDLGTNKISYTLDGVPVVVNIPDYGDTTGLTLPAGQIHCGELLTITES
jgi:hypothetical protein